MELIEIGKIVNTHGTRGEIKLNPWTDSLESLLELEDFYYKKNNQVYSLKALQVRIHKNCAIIKFQDINDLNTAETYRNVILYVEKEENLLEGRYYIADLIGLCVVSDEGSLGTVTDVFPTGANDVYEVRTEEGKMIYLPAISQVVKKIDLQAKQIKVRLLEGLLD